MNEHLIFFDSECPFCHRSVARIIELDSGRHFLFAPLNGETAIDILSGPQKYLRGINSLVLVEDYQSTNRNFWTRSRGVSRVYWLIGGQWRLFGLFSFLPAWVGDWLYIWVAEHRHQFKLKMPQEAGPKDRFLP